MRLENLVSDSVWFNVSFRHYILAKKGSLFSGNQPGENSLITHSSAKSNVYQNIYFHFQKTNRQAKKKNTKKVKETKEEKL